MESETHPPIAEAQSRDTVLDLLSDRRRRCLLSVLADRNAPMSVAELAAEVAGRELDAEPTEVPAERTDSVAVTLHHNHLPRLADADLISYEPETKTAALTDRVPSLVPERSRRS